MVHPLGANTYQVSAFMSRPSSRKFFRRDICEHVRKLLRGIASALIVSSTWLALMAQTAPDAKANIAALEEEVKKHLQEQKPQLAIPVLRQIVSLDPNNVNARANLGVLLY